MTHAEIAATSPRPHARFLIMLTIVVALVAVLSFAPLLMSFMAFDAGETPEAWATFIGIWMIPVVMIVALVVAWIGYAAGSRLTMRIGMIVCLIPLALLGVLACVTVANMLWS